MDVQQVQIDLYSEAGQGAYDVEVQAGPKDLASPDDLPAQSDDLSLEVRPENFQARRLTFTTVVPGPFGSEPLTPPVGCSVRISITHLMKQRSSAWRDGY